MNKFLIATVLAITAFAASATEVGVTVNRDYAGDNRNGAGITIGKKYANGLSVTGAFERTTVDENQNRFSVTGGYALAKLGPVTVGPKLGLAYLDNANSRDGYALTVGIGAEMPLTHRVSLTADFGRQFGQDRVQQYDGNRFTTGLKYSF